MELKKQKNQVIVTLTGKMYVEEASLLRDKLIKEINNQQCDFIIDVSRLEFIDSSGLGVLVGIHKKLKQCCGKSLEIQGAQGQIKELFELTRLTSVFDFN